MRRVLSAASLLLLLLGSVAGAAAQSGDYLLIYTYTCETYHEDIFVGFGELPEDCAMTGGVSISVTDQTGTVVSECTTSEVEWPGACSVQVPLGTTITVTEDVSTVPAGYAPTRNPIVIETDPAGYPGEFIREFINVAEGSVTLPNTGVGSAVPADRSRDVPFTMIILLLSSVAFTLWRRSLLISKN
jgi:hypothetical protein